MVSFYALLLENLFAELLFISFFIYYTKIPFNLLTSFLNFLFIFLFIFSYFFIDSHNYVTWIIISFLFSTIGTSLYYLINKLFSTRYWFITFIFPIAFLFFFNSIKLVHTLAFLFLSN